MANIPRYLEISFWKISIALMKSEKAMRILFISIGVTIIIALISISLYALRFFGDVETEALAAAAPQFPEIEFPLIQTPTNQTTQPVQKNILIVFAEGLDQDQPSLKGVWLGIFQASKPQVIFLPVFPTPNPTNEYEDKSLVALFNIQPNGEPVPEFYNYVQHKDIRWDHVVLLDNHALALIMEETNGLDLGEGKLSGASSVTEFSLGQENAQAAQIAQGMLLRGLCQETDHLIQSVFPSEEFVSISTHWYSDLDLPNILSEPTLTDPIAGLSCEVPVLKEVSMNSLEE
jgi:hypothetical protein